MSQKHGGRNAPGPTQPTPRLPSVDTVLRDPASAALLDSLGHHAVREAVRTVLDEKRTKIRHGTSPGAPDAISAEAIATAAGALAAARMRTTPAPVHNLTGIVLHTNLGRAPLPPEAIAAATIAAGAGDLEYDLVSGKRGDRDAAVEDRLHRLTGAEAALVVNNNAAALLLILNTLANRRQVPVSRGELIEIGGSFRLPELMSRAGCKLVEVGTTNRTHHEDYAGAISDRTALLMKVHASNYAIEGFTAEVPPAKLATLAHQHDLPFVVDLGSGALVNLTQFGLPAEPTPDAVLDAGADLVSFSGDKLLGGPQAGLVVGRKDLVARLRRNPMRRALRCDKLTLAALDAVLAIYETPERLPDALPALRLLARKETEIRTLCERLAPQVQKALGDSVTVEIQACASQIGSGAQPTRTLASCGLALAPRTARRGAALKRLATTFRRLPVPVIGRIHDDTLLFDLRCLEDESAFAAQLGKIGSQIGSQIGSGWPGEPGAPAP